MPMPLETEKMEELTNDQESRSLGQGVTEVLWHAGPSPLPEADRSLKEPGMSLYRPEEPVFQELMKTSKSYSFLTLLLYRSLHPQSRL